MKYVPETEAEWRSGLVWPALRLPKGSRQRGAALRRIAAARHRDHTGAPRAVSVATLRRWLRDIERGGVIAIGRNAA